MAKGRYRTRRQTRYDILRVAGFLDFEARVLSRVARKTPPLNMLIRERYREFIKAREDGRSWTWWQNNIHRKYSEKEYDDDSLGKWQRENKHGAIKDDPFKMLDDAERRYRDKHPEYESPWERRRKRWRDFIDKVKNSYDITPTPRMRKAESRLLRGAKADRWLEQ